MYYLFVWFAAGRNVCNIRNAVTRPCYGVTVLRNMAIRSTRFLPISSAPRGGRADDGSFYDPGIIAAFRAAGHRGCRPRGIATFWWQKVAPKPSACRFRGNVVRPALSECSKNKTMQPPAPGARAFVRSFSAPSDNAAISRCHHFAPHAANGGEYTRLDAGAVKRQTG